MNSDFEALKKLDKAIKIFKEAGFKFTQHSIIDTDIYGTAKDFSKRVIEVRCYKYYTTSDSGSCIRGLESFNSKAGILENENALEETMFNNRASV